MRVPGRPAPGAAATRTSARPSVSVYSAVPDGSLPLLMYGSMALEASAPAGDTVRGLAACFGLHRPDRHRVQRSGRSATAGPRRAATASRRRVGIPRHPARQHPRPDRNGRRKSRHHDRRRKLKPQPPLAQRRQSGSRLLSQPGVTMQPVPSRVPWTPWDAEDGQPGGQDYAEAQSRSSGRTVIQSSCVYACSPVCRMIASSSRRPRRSFS